MTCIAGIIENTKIFIGAESAGTDSDANLTIRKAPKVFRVRDFLIGGAGSFRINQIVEHVFIPPPRPARMNIKRYMVSEFIPELRLTLLNQGALNTIKGTTQEYDGNFLVGYKEHLFLIYDDFDVEEIQEHYHACGCASAYALGALYASGRINAGPEERLEQAIQAAVKFSGACRGPIIIRSI
jgi:hypothetical protein